MNTDTTISTNETTLATSEPTPSPKNVPHRMQSRHIATRIIAARELLNAVQNDPELKDLGSAYGYTEQLVNEGLDLQAAAQNAYNTRQQAIGARKQASQALSAQLRQCINTYSAFRILARGLFPGGDTRAALGLTGKLPRDMAQLIAQAHASYRTSLDSPAYLAALTEHGCTKEILQANLEQLDALVSAINTQDAAHADAVTATRTRSEALTALQDWLNRFNGVAYYATRGRPDLAERLGL